MMAALHEAPTQPGRIGSVCGFIPTTYELPRSTGLSVIERRDWIATRS
jgi:hypothetical protein